jgi:hypothetical protein
LQRVKGFSPRYISWIENFISEEGSVAVNVNDKIGDGVAAVRSKVLRACLVYG